MMRYLFIFLCGASIGAGGITAVVKNKFEAWEESYSDRLLDIQLCEERIRGFKRSLTACYFGKEFPPGKDESKCAP